MPALIRLSLIASILLLTSTIASVSAAEKKAKPASKLKVNALEAALSKQLTNGTLVGSFTVDGQNAGKPPRAERYDLGTVKKINAKYWLFVAKVKYGKKNFSIPVPITVQIAWAGDTPVITMTNVTIPTMGTFTARVLFYGDRYVGTWQHGKAGGHMFGKIEPAKKKKAPAKK
jgi:hypothetical protein